MPAGTVGYASPEQHALVDTFNVVLWALVLSLACYLPARRATEIDPMAALREE